MAITREDYVTQSVQTYVSRALFNDPPEGRGYPEEQIEFLNDFSEDMYGPSEELTQNKVASGFDFDDQGRQGELGSDLVRRLYTLEFFVLGISSVWAKNIAQAIKFSVEHDGIIPLLDIADAASAPDWPQIDALVLVGAQSNRVPVTDPAPWQRHVWVTRVRVEDEYNARLT